MRVLAIDTATPSASAALVQDGHILAECSAQGQKNHSELLLQMIDRLFDWSGSGRTTVDLLAVSTGPGSFTGLRVGISTAQGMAFALDRPLAGIPTLDVIAAQSAAGELISPMIDARKLQVYAALYRSRGRDVMQVRPPAVLAPESWVQNLPGPAVLIGTGASVYRAGIEAAAAERGCIIAREHLGIPRAATVAALASERYPGCAGGPELVAALYVRPPDAILPQDRA